MVMTLLTIKDMRKALIVDMTVVITEGIEIVGLMMIFGAIGMPSAGGDCI